MVFMSLLPGNILKEDWNRFVLENGGSFLQSFEWGEFQKSFGRRIFRFSGDDWQAQFMEMIIPVIGKKYWYCPRGPVVEKSKIKNQKSKVQFKIKNLINEIKKAIDKNAIFFRLGPEWEIENINSHSERSPVLTGRSEESHENTADLYASARDSSSRAAGLRMTKLFEENGFKRLPYDIEPAQTLILDLNKGSEELLAEMHPKWRYNINLAQKKGVVIKKITSRDADFDEYFEKFYQLLDKGTAERQKIKHHPKDYYYKQLTISSKHLSAELFVAEYDKKAVAANIVVFFGNRATYVHGATDNEHRALMAPHLLQWRQICEAKGRCLSEYDFWGIANEYSFNKLKTTWAGITRFKKGFGGREMNYIGYFDWPISKIWYLIYRVAQRIRR